MRAVGDQAKTDCRILQLCGGFEDGIEEANHAVAQRWKDRTAPALEGRVEEESKDGSIVA